MDSYSLIAPAKINLYLEIIGDRIDGYHQLAMVMQSIELADQVDISANGNKSIKVHCQSLGVPNDNTNLAYRAAELMAENFPDAFAHYGGVDITIHKNIPVAAGLAGGSTNAAAVLVGVALLWDLGLTQIEIEELGASLGSDVPFCVRGGTAIATGRGEEITSILGLNDIYVVLGKHKNISVSTPWAYKSYRAAYGDSYIRDQEDLVTRASAVHSAPIVQAIIHKNIKEICQQLHNDLEKVVLPEYSQVSQLRTAFAASGALGTMMSGSGPSVFAICESKPQAEFIKEQVQRGISDTNLELFVTKLISHGIQVTSAK
jgi:4-diphosphocytidyl-2-C-methyl-D-erythritol kinase